MSNGDSSLTTARLAIFAIALYRRPHLALSVLVYGIATDPEGLFLNAILPAIVGASVGIVLVGSSSIRSAKIRRGSRWERVGLMAVPLAAIVGVIGNDLPRWFNAGVEGWAIGFFLALAVFLIGAWRNDPEFRRRIESARSTET